MKRNLFSRKQKVKNNQTLRPSHRRGKTLSLTKGPRLAKPDPYLLLAWYDQNRRLLPWRALPGTAIDPYHVWLSEIMLQQTTVAAVAPYFQKFIRRWPSLRALAKAPIEEIMQMWAGLGYYRRARLLHTCAQHICLHYDAEFPSEESALLVLPGFGPYTAAAVAAIAFDQRANVVDGNVERVIARLYAIETPLPKAKAEIRTCAARLLPVERYGDYAQALMDLGATICTPRNPKCDLCPMSASCKARALGIQDQVPQRLPKEVKPVRRAIAFVLMDQKKRILLRRRPPQGLLGGMMEVPSSVWQEGAMPPLKKVLKEAPFPARWSLLPGRVTHVFSHFKLEVSIARAKAPRSFPGHWVAPNDLSQEALPSVMRKVLDHALDASHKDPRPLG